MHFLQINNPFATATISLYGAQVLSYLPHGQKDVLWLSKQALYQDGQAIRGGIPICWPWFGSRKGFPSHGFARTSLWNLQKIEDLEDHRTRVVLSLTSNETTRKWWKHEFVLTVEVMVGNQLEVKLTTQNSGSQPINITEALHTYYQVSGIEDIAIEGLENHTFFNKLTRKSEKQNGSIQFEQEKDAVYQHSGEVIINDERWHRHLKIHKANSKSTIVWNPWEKTSDKMHDLGPKCYREFVCVEAGNVSEPLSIPSGKSHTLTMIIDPQSI